MKSGHTREDFGPGTPHTLFEDVYAIVVGTILLATGLVMLQAGKLATGGVAGLALTLSYMTDLPVGLLYVVISLPLLAITARSMGRDFFIKTIVVTVTLFGLMAVAQHAIVVQYVARPVGAIVGGTLIGMGALALARHSSGTGGSGAVVLWLYRTRGWNAGRTQMIMDGCVLLFSLITLDAVSMLWSLLGVAATAGILFLWHRPGRYTGY